MISVFKIHIKTKINNYEKSINHVRYYLLIHGL